MLEYRVELHYGLFQGLFLFMLNIWTSNNLNESINISDVMLSRYFLCAFLARQFSVVWVVFCFEEDSLLGKVSPYLIQPLNPFFQISPQHLAEQIIRFPFALIIASFFLFLIHKVYGSQTWVFYSFHNIYFLFFLNQFLVNQ